MDTTLHATSFVHASLLKKYTNRFGTTIEPIAVSSELRNTLMSVGDIAFEHSRTVSEHELTSKMTKVNPVATLIAKLQDADKSSWSSIVATFVSTTV